MLARNGAFLLRTIGFLAVATLLTESLAYPQQGQKDEPTWESLKKHQVPEWYQDAKLGIFVHWGLYSVPAWAPPPPRENLRSGFRLCEFSLRIQPVGPKVESR